MAERSSDRVKLTGVHVLEEYEIDLGEGAEAPGDDIEAYFRAVRELLEREGHEVRGMLHARRSGSDQRTSAATTARGVPAGWYHYVYPDWLWSHWIYIER